MCLAIPGQVVELTDADKRLARVNVAGVTRVVSIGLLDTDDGSPGADAGDWVLIHVGFAISRVDEAEALATLDLLERMGTEYEEEMDEIRRSAIQ